LEFVPAIEEVVDFGMVGVDGGGYGCSSGNVKVVQKSMIRNPSF